MYRFLSDLRGLVSFGIVLGAIFLSSSVFAEELIDADRALKEIFPGEGSWEQQEVVLSEEQIHLLEKIAAISFDYEKPGKTMLYILKGEDRVLGYAFEDTVLGKWGPIHYVVGINDAGEVLRVIVLDYQEIRGRPVAKRRFLRQYEGKTAHDPVRLREDIDGISGATISSRSLTDGIRKIINIFELKRDDL